MFGKESHSHISMNPEVKKKFLFMRILNLEWKCRLTSKKTSQSLKNLGISAVFKNIHYVMNKKKNIFLNLTFILQHKKNKTDIMFWVFINFLGS